MKARTLRGVNAKDCGGSTLSRPNEVHVAWLRALGGWPLFAIPGTGIAAQRGSVAIIIAYQLARHLARDWRDTLSDSADRGRAGGFWRGLAEIPGVEFSNGFAMSMATPAGSQLL